MNPVDDKTTAIIGKWCNGSTSTYLRFKIFRTSKNKLKNEACKTPTTVDELVDTLKVRKTCKPKIFCLVKTENHVSRLHAVITCCMANDSISATKVKPLVVDVSKTDGQRIKRVFKLIKPSNKLFLNNKIYYNETVQMTHVLCNH